MTSSSLRSLTLTTHLTNSVTLPSGGLFEVGYSSWSLLNVETQYA